MTNNKEFAIETVAALFTAAFTAEVTSKAPYPCTIDRRFATGIESGQNVRWFKQPFEGPPNLDLFVGIPENALEMLFRRPATREPLDQGEVLPLLRDGLEKTFNAFARTLSTTVGAGIACVSLVEEAPPPATEKVSLELRQDFHAAGEILLGLPEPTVNSLVRLVPFSGAADVAQNNAHDRRSASVEPHRLDVLMNIDLPVSISFGSVEMTLGDVLKLTTGSIVELNHLLNQPIDVVVNKCLVARGEVVVADGNYAIHVSEVVSPRTIT